MLIEIKKKDETIKKSKKKGEIIAAKQALIIIFMVWGNLILHFEEFLSYQLKLKYLIINVSILCILF